MLQLFWNEFKPTGGALDADERNKQSAKLLSIASDEPTGTRTMTHNQFAGWIRQCCADPAKFRSAKERHTPRTRPSTAELAAQAMAADMAAAHAMLDEDEPAVEEAAPAAEEAAPAEAAPTAAAEEATN